MFVQSPKNIPKALFDPSSDLIELSTPLASPYMDMDMDFSGSTKEESKW